MANDSAYIDPPGTRMAAQSAYIDRRNMTRMAQESAYGQTFMANDSAYIAPPGTRMASQSAYIDRRHIKIYSDGDKQDFCVACYDTLPSAVRKKLNLKGYDRCRLCSSSQRTACSHYFWCDICFASGIHFGETNQLFMLLQMKKSIDFALLQSDTEILEILLKDIIYRYPDHPPTQRELFEKLRADVLQGGFGYNLVTANSIVSLYMSFVDTTLLPGGYKVFLRDPRK